LKRNALKVFEEKPQGKRPLGRTRHIWENKIEVDLRGME
jgi:hypothetical protein